jgi:putative SOS response-associated peptidase YedK
MCGRYAITLPPEAMTQLFAARWEGPAFGPRYNVAPSQAIPIVRLGADGAREIVPAAWGLHPTWMKEGPGAKSMINARSETAAEKPFFRDAMKKRRCLVPADGYYEWRRDGAVKTPHYIYAKDGAPLVFAGLWERWRDRESDAWVDTAAILTAAAHPSIAALHDRMPVMLGHGAWEAWLDPASPKETAGFLIEAALALPPALAFHEVSRAVNSPRNDGPMLIEPV